VRLRFSAGLVCSHNRCAGPSAASLSKWSLAASDLNDEDIELAVCAHSAVCLSLTAVLPILGLQDQDSLLAADVVEVVRPKGVSRHPLR
jgi:hypothetical protein